jgi:hypothetical protein
LLPKTSPSSPAFSSRIDRSSTAGAVVPTRNSPQIPSCPLLSSLRIPRLLRRFFGPKSFNNRSKLAKLSNPSAFSNSSKVIAALLAIFPAKSASPLTRESSRNNGRFSIFSSSAPAARAPYSNLNYRACAESKGHTPAAGHKSSPPRSAWPGIQRVRDVCSSARCKEV